MNASCDCVQVCLLIEKGRMNRKETKDEDTWCDWQTLHTKQQQNTGSHHKDKWMLFTRQDCCKK